MESYERLRELVEAASADVAKASGGNKAAGTRVRKTMQEIKETAQTVRKRILEVRSDTHAKLDGKLTLRMSIGGTMTVREHVQNAWEWIRLAAEECS